MHEGKIRLLIAKGAAMADTGISRYDRDFLLHPAKRDQIVELWEVEKFGRDSFGDPGAVSLYGMTPAQWHPVASVSLPAPRWRRCATL